ncbi:hypothetical protein diail_6819 [Diaporthe ilicicola]|nr:hypothetical protein diail_6819 [Diaporthe ilicicola]
MRFSTIPGIALAVAGLTSAQLCSSTLKLVDFENAPGVAPLGVGPLSALIPNGYAGLNWANLYGVQPSIAAQFILPQGKVFAVAPNSPSTNPPVISALQGQTFKPQAIFVGTFNTGLVSGAAAVPVASTVTVTATFIDGTTAQTTFNFDPPNTVFGLAINGEAMQYFTFPCEWTSVVSLSFRPQAKNGINTLLAFALDNFQYN